MTDAFREYLYRPRTLAERAIELEVEIQTLWSACTKMSTTFGKIGGVGGSSVGNAKDGDKAALSDLDDLYLRCQQDMRATVTEMLRFSDAIAQDTRNPYAKRDAAILRFRYARRLDWVDVAGELARRGFQWENLRTVYKWHSSALPRIEKIWEETHDYQRKE